MTYVPLHAPHLSSSLIWPRLVSYNMHVSLSYAELFPTHINYVIKQL